MLVHRKSKIWIHFEYCQQLWLRFELALSRTDLDLVRTHGFVAKWIYFECQIALLNELFLLNNPIWLNETNPERPSYLTVSVNVSILFIAIPTRCAWTSLQGSAAEPTGACYSSGLQKPATDTETEALPFVHSNRGSWLTWSVTQRKIKDHTNESKL